MTQPLPESLKAWIEKEAENIYKIEQGLNLDDFHYVGSAVRQMRKEAWIQGAEFLYNHLKGLPDERDKEIRSLKAQVENSDDIYKLQSRTILMHVKEIERLKGLVEKLFFKEYPFPEQAKEDNADDWQQFKTENNLQP